MGNFNRDNRSSRRDSGRFDRRDSGGYGGRDSGRSSFRKQMHEATCAKCGQRCEVPFRPTGDKPVYCNSCFRKDDNFSSPKRTGKFRKEYGGKPAPEQSFQHAPEFEKINRKLDAILRILEGAKQEKVEEISFEDKPAPKEKKREIKKAEKKAIKKAAKKNAVKKSAAKKKVKKKK